MKAVILAGGHGTRLYPLSTLEKPKQFINLIGDKTLFQQTVDRLNFLDPKDIFVATNQEYTGLVREQAPQIPEKNIFVEPAMRNTSTCIGYAAIQLSKRLSNSTSEQDPDEVMCIIYADHLVRDTAEFAKKLQVAEQVAREENTINIIEVEAREPSTKLGYVKIGEMLREIDDVPVHEFKEFKEKPDLETATKYLENGDYLWNTGFYVWQISKILEKYRQHAPETYNKLQEDHYEECENISIDYAIMEKLDPSEVRIIPATLGWSDIGTWESLFEELEKSGETEKIEDFRKIREE
ncbi:mannose-1-phosphate guanylyltransferase [Candidatus Peregrinibacteria bacterium]|jgi:mannose-1-phosphate guanylyltransferase|nr:mannose-1-phosphate guanylyltransferase [Candidatus Peregrinibacteria bacterium]MBT4055633.1 mannose-1-phosphate guanylyltransferase [Candidatus Peregrinibacteria bacterium]